MSSEERDTRKVVLVTGASAGIGRVCAEHLAAAGWRVFGAQRRVLAPDRAPRGVEMIAMDITDDAAVERTVAEVLRAAGRIDAVINNAGISYMGSVEDTSIEEAKAQLEPNFFGVLRVCRAVLPVMRRQGGGYIVNISSLAGIVGLPFSGLYAASKFALEGVSESLRLETRRFGIKVVLVQPGDFDTEMPAVRRTARAAEENDAYRQEFVRFHTQQAKDEANAPTPEPIARLVERILRDPNPRLRYSVGMLGQRIVVPLKRLLPQRFFEWTLRQVLRI